VVVGGALLVKSLVGDKPDKPNNTPVQTAPSTSAPANPNQPPAGFTRYKHPGGFSVNVPAGWKPDVKQPGRLVDVEDPNSSQFLRLIHTPDGNDPKAALAAGESGFAQTHKEYKQITLGTVKYRNYTAADWEFTYSNDGVTRHVLYRLFLVDGSTYAIYLSAPEETWTASKRYFDVAAGSFAVG
jgi:hypothetical protein